MTTILNPLRYREKTFGQLYTELQDRLGFVRQGKAANKNKALLRSFLQEAHEIVVDKVGPASSKKVTAIQLESGSKLYDFQNDIEIEDIDPSKILNIYLKTSDTERFFLPQGISEIDRARAEVGRPTRWDTLNGQIELNPIPDDGGYELVIEYIAVPGRFSQDSDLCSVNSRLVFLYALQAAQTYLRRPESSRTMQAFTSLLRMEMNAQHQNKRYFIGQPDNSRRTVTGKNGEYRYIISGDR